MDSENNATTQLFSGTTELSNTRSISEGEHRTFRPLHRVVPCILDFLKKYNIVVVWFVFIILALLPVFTDNLRPLWRFICWVAPTVLAIEVDAGNRSWVYVTKTVIWLFQIALTQYMLNVTDGFRSKSNLRTVGLPLSLLLFVASCLVTIIGRRQKNIIWTKTDEVKGGNNVHVIDKTVYADLDRMRIKTPLSLNELNDAWISDADDLERGRRTLTAAEISHHVIRTSLVTQYIISRIFKDASNRVFVHSPVTKYRTWLLTFALTSAGLIQMVRSLFSNDKGREIMTDIILWMTLAVLTLPSIAKIKFGSNASLLRLLKGLLPAENDIQMWQRLGVSAEDLYAALMNAISMEKVFKDSLGLLQGRGRGSVKVVDILEAKKLCIRSLLRIGSSYVRISDGFRFVWMEPNLLMPVATVARSVSNRNAESTPSEDQLEISGEGTADEESYGKGEFFLKPGVRVLWTNYREEEISHTE